MKEFIFGAIIGACGGVFAMKNEQVNVCDVMVLDQVLYGWHVQ